LDEDPWKDNAELARRVVCEGLGVLQEKGGPVVKTIGKLTVLSQGEADELAAFGDRIEAYFQLKNPERPLCLGVFGPPGSGKSFAVKQVLADKKHALHVLNLGQLQGPGDLSSALAEAARVEKQPVVFFDEFDSRLGGTPLGWLQWLLAPMQDGFILHQGKPIELKRAVFVFAGGTADRFEEFPDAHEEHFRASKGPDFISRLRGHTNIRGVNDGPYRSLRRALVLRLAVERVAPGLLDKDKKIPDASMPRDLIDQILAVGRFRHGARSVEALVEMSTKPDSQKFSGPPAEAHASHIDLGPLSHLVIALSAGGREGDYEARLDEVWPAVARRLLELGAGLVYGGAEQKQGFTERLIEERLPNLLGSDERPNDLFARPRSSRVTWVRRATGPIKGKLHERVDVRQLPGLSKEELSELSGSDERLGNTLSLFRMRALITRWADAHLAFGGKTSGSSGRFPGIAEEVMLSLAAGNAVYVCGGFGGAAEAVGQVLGLGKPWSLTPDCLRRKAHGRGAAPLEAAVQQWGPRFQLPHRIDLPLDYEHLVEFLRAHALGGEKWPDNGLTPDENRTLFRSTKADEIVKLVTKGLGRRFANS
jgi:hypothetical protein